jgi:hypothetical protein
VAALDLNKLASTAVEAYLQGAKQAPSNGHVETKTKHRRLGTGTAMAMGAGLAFAAGAAYRRMRAVDLEEIGHAVEDKLKS